MCEGDEEIINEVRPPARTGKVASFFSRDLHLRKEKTVAPKLVVVVAPGWAAAVDSPIPKRKNNNVCYPKKRGRGEKLERRFFVRR